jgi:hypothetical protein
MTSVAEVFASTQRMFGDESNVQLTQDDVVRWVGDACVEIANQNEDVFTSVYLVTPVVGQQKYSMSFISPNLPNKAHVKSVMARDVANGPYYTVPFKSTQQFNDEIGGWDGDTYTDSSPMFYTREAGNIILWPTPNQVITNGLKLTLTGVIPTISPGTNLEDILPTYYTNTIKQFVLMQAYEMDENMEMAALKAQQVQGDLNSNYGREAWYGQEKYPVINSGMEDYS